MIYVCLAAGKGSRLGALGSYLQKCMYPIGIRPFVEYSVRNAVHTKGCTQLVFVVQHHQEQLRRYFGAAYEGVPITYVEQTELLGTGHAVKTVQDTLATKMPMLIWLADAYVPSQLFQAVYDHPYDNVLTLAPAKGEVSDPKVGVDVDDQQVTRAWQGTGGLYDVGLWKFSADTVAELTQVKEREYRVLPNVQGAIDAKGSSFGYVVADEWLHLGGTKPSAEACVLAVGKRIVALEQLAV